MKLSSGDRARVFAEEDYAYLQLESDDSLWEAELTRRQALRLARKLRKVAARLPDVPVM